MVSGPTPKCAELSGLPDDVEHLAHAVAGSSESDRAEFVRFAGYLKARSCFEGGGGACWRGAVLHGAQTAAHLHRWLESRQRTDETGARIDVFDAIAGSGVLLLFRPLDGLLGVFLPEPAPGVMVTTKRPLSVQRHIAARGLGAS